MSISKSILADAPTVPEYAAECGRSRGWGYRLVKNGLPVFEVNGVLHVHRPTANKWHASRMRSRGRKFAMEAA